MNHWVTSRSSLPSCQRRRHRHRAGLSTLRPLLRRPWSLGSPMRRLTCVQCGSTNTLYCPGKPDGCNPSRHLVRTNFLTSISDRHIDSLSQLTGEPADSIRHWFGRLMKQGMSTGDSAYKSQTALQFPSADHFWNDNSTLAQIPQLPTEESTQESMTTPDLPAERETTTVTQSANALRGGKKSRCTPTTCRRARS